VPAPEKFKVTVVRILPLTVPLRLGKDPVAPAYGPVPPVMVAEPLPLVAPPVNSDAGIESLPVMVPPPPDKVTVNGAVAMFEVMSASEREPSNVPLRMFVRVAVPVAVKEPVVAESEPVAFTVMVVLI